jgi:hypothetical protein
MKAVRMKTQGAHTTYFFQTVAVRSWSTKLMSKDTSHRSAMRKLVLGFTKVLEE